MAELSAHAPLVRGRGAGGRGKGSRSTQRKGEVQQATAAGLDLLRVLGWLVLHDASVPEDPDGSIDYVLAGPSGVYVVNTVGWSGPISADDGVLTVGGTDRSDALTDVAAAADLVRRLLGAVPVAPLLCFERLESVTGVAGDVALCASENILDLLTTQPEILDPTAVARASRSLSAAFQTRARPQVRAVEPTPARSQPSSGPTLDELVRARSEETTQTASVEESSAVDVARIESLEHLMGGSAAPITTPVSSITEETSRRHRFGLRRGSKKHVPAPEALVESPAEVDVVLEVATDEASSRVARSSDATAVGDAGAALWLSLTDAPDSVALDGVTPDELLGLDVEAALAEAEALQRAAEEADRERAERAAVEMRQREEQVARERAQEEAEQEAEELRRREADQARKRAAQEARENLEREARALAERERLEQEAREQAEREEAARLEQQREQEAREEAARLEQERLEQEAREQAEREEAARLEQQRLEQRLARKLRVWSRRLASRRSVRKPRVWSSSAWSERLARKPRVWSRRLASRPSVRKPRAGAAARAGGA